MGKFSKPWVSKEDWIAQKKADGTFRQFTPKEKSQYKKNKKQYDYNELTYEDKQEWYEARHAKAIAKEDTKKQIKEQNALAKKEQRENKKKQNEEIKALKKKTAQTKAADETKEEKQKRLKEQADIKSKLQEDKLLQKDNFAEGISNYEYLEFRQGSSRKFWSCRLDPLGNTTYVEFGRIGGAARDQTKSYCSYDKAREVMLKLVASKFKKGYCKV